MKNLYKLLNDSYRVIEFTTCNSYLTKNFIDKEKILTISKCKQFESDNIFFLNQEHFITAIRKNSCDLIILNSPGFRELKALQKTVTASLLFQKINLISIFFIAYFFIKGLITGRQKYIGIYFLFSGIKISFYIGVKKLNTSNKVSRHYLSPLVHLEDFFQNLNDNKINYCILRWFENLPEIELNEDIDLMVDDDDLEKVLTLINQIPGILPLDIYSESGTPGTDFNGLPYYTFSLAEKVLSETILFKDVYKVPTWENYFYLMAYHAVFHKGERSGLSSKKYNLTITSNPEHDYLFHLKNILSKTDLSVNSFNLEELHAFLHEKGFAPPLDTQYKLSLNNHFLQNHIKEYHDKAEHLKKFEGLVCFVARERIIENGLLQDLTKYIQKAGFTILKTQRLEEPFKNEFTKRVRGGNWNQGPWPVSGGLPVALVIALDVYPIEPRAKDYQEHPGLTNKRIKNKDEIRDSINLSLANELEWFNGIHSSDNEIQAIEYLKLAGVNEDEIYEEITKHKRAFKTKYPVLDTLSRFSKRAKVELISLNGQKAVKKTFKPNCEWFLDNEIEAYTKLKEFNNIPRLLEVGDNYIITSYIEGSEPLNKRISISTFKKCLDLLHKVYDKGYSLLDFQPGNFLSDSKNNIYLIDFEFLHKYENKPSFLQCYDLTGIPKDFHPLHFPDNRIPAGEIQFNVLWTNRTGIKYQDIPDIESFKAFFISFCRYYSIKIKNRLSIFKCNSKSIIKKIIRALP